MKIHPTHETRISDASSFDEICKKCGATDRRGSDLLEQPCPKADSEPHEGPFLVINASSTSSNPAPIGGRFTLLEVD